MSDTEEVPPELSVEAKAFLAKHEGTGEPSAEALERGRRRLGAPVTPLRLVPRQRRTLFAPEVLAAAAMVLLLLGAQVLSLAWRVRTEPVAETVPVEVKPELEVNAVLEAWRTGDFEGANRLASQECHSARCGPLASKVKKLLGFTQRRESLSAEEEEELTSFDKSAAEGPDGVLRGIRQVREPKDATALFTEAQAQKKAKNFDEAAELLEECTRIEPPHAPCFRLLGSVRASLASRDVDAAQMRLARRAYQRFLELASADDEFAERVRLILEAAGESDDDAIPAQAGSASKPITVKALVVGGSVTVDLGRPLSRLALGDPAIADISVLGPNEVRVKGIGAGKTTLMVWFSEGDRDSMVIEVKESGRAKDKIDELYAEAGRARAAQDWRSSMMLVRRILALDSQHPGALQLQNEARSQAREFYMRGYQLRESSPTEALEFFQLALEMTPPDDQTHQKASYRLNELRRE